MDKSATESSAQRQVRVQLTTKNDDIALPDNAGPILVPTGERMSLTLKENLQIDD